MERDEMNPKAIFERIMKEMERIGVTKENTTIGMEDIEMTEENGMIESEGEELREESVTEMENEEMAEKNVTGEVESKEIGKNGKTETEETENEKERNNGKRRWINDESKETNKRRKRVINEEVEGKDELTTVQKLIWELTTSEVKEKVIEESGNNERSLTERYLRASKRGNDVIKHWYYYGRDFIGRIKTMKRTKRKLFKEQEARKILYKEIEEASGGMALKVIKENTRKAINVYKIFSEIGVERINRVKHLVTIA